MIPYFFEINVSHKTKVFCDIDDFSEDDFLLEALETRERYKILNYVIGTVYRYNEMEFREHFRLRKDIVNNIARQYEQNVLFNLTRGFGKISAKDQLSIFL